MANGTTNSPQVGLKAAALFEALKGLLVILAGLGLLAFVHRDAQAFAERLVRHMHLNPARHYPRIFIEAASHLNDTRLRGLAALATLYALVRFVEAYGLWRTRTWAEWFAIIAGSVYVPVEIYELWKHPTVLRALVL